METIIERLAAHHGAITAPELGRLLGLDRSTIFRFAKSGRLPHYRIGANLRFDPVLVAEWLRAREVKRAA